jgi:8-oxo-dGTP pyrophosphatase MutT (NUDIX family)
LIEKVCPIVLRHAATGRDILVFRHPVAGIQLIKGTRDAGESVEAGALRELAEESGIADAGVMGDLGSSATIVPGQLWHFVAVETGDLPERWTFDTNDDGGRRFAFSWWPLASEPGADWHESFIRALHHVRSAFR